MLALPGGTTQMLDLPPGLPLGLGAESFVATQIGLPPGATLALYTDRLVQSRARSLDDGLAALRDELSRALAEPGPARDLVQSSRFRMPTAQGLLGAVWCPYR